MIRFFTSFFLFLLLAAVEFAFLNSLPAPFFFIPLIFACGLYLFQRLGSNIGLWWLLALGVYLDFWRLGLIFGETVVYVITILFVIFLGRQLFTNRSFYGVLSNAVLSLWFLHFINFGWFFIKKILNDDFSFPWQSVMVFVFWQTVFLVLLITVLFFLAQRVQFFLKRLLILSNRENL